MIPQSIPVWTILGMDRLDYQKKNWPEKRKLIEKAYGKPKRLKEKTRKSNTGSYLLDAFMKAGLPGKWDAQNEKIFYKWPDIGNSK